MVTKPAVLRVLVTLAASAAAVALATSSIAQTKPTPAPSASASPSWVAIAVPSVTTMTSASPAPATSAAPKPVGTGVTSPLVHHAPIIVAKPHEELKIEARIEYGQLVQRLFVRYRTAPGEAPREVPFLRGSDDRYLAVIPSDDVKPPGLAYGIVVERTDGAVVDVFGGATPGQLHDVSVTEDIADQRERVLLDRLEGRRSVVSTSFDYVQFGNSSANSAAGKTTIHDGYYRTEGVYTYRPLRSIVEFSIRLGVMRGTSPVAASATAAGDNKVGLNYGSPSILFRITDGIHAEGSFLTSVTEQGFSIGGGAAVHIGDVYGSKLVLGIESIRDFGTRGFARLDLVKGRFRVSPMIEVTNMPHADRAGLRLITEVGLGLGQGWQVAARIGYQARDFDTGGPGLGVSLGYAF